MKRNIGRTDRIIRIVLGVVLIALGFYFSSWWGAIGLIPLATAAIGWCPLYAPFKISTCPAQERST
jgi:sulfite exporter TauE/SafE